ncbi:MerR family transcriptional regulator [Aerococcaceae bacterium NML191292]|nr:MerR family transcriptional regulator [Aerococcaceae bacterium NML210727]MCW6654888.1 MerR family transcriptional regulator [Aerococcaceae bacterium NML201296]MCW6660099.1 MerR family transcriptional regulator [Aerococcaceae bacterium NML191292]MCW6662126.1 MerR family transcriptional regulator [Aerococcaceae bacterium NML201209]MCW6662668.1 MerR family transcriptional regulator [Aerococcaceae bacterium NML190073]MCW6665729.1 MerR family transcriptional regulator [Aerococcaceae bacterium NM
MAEKAFRKSLAVFPIGTVMSLTGLSARQIRYYEDYKLIVPKRSSTNRRMYSLNDVDRLLEIIDLVEEGMTLKGIQKRYNKNVNSTDSKGQQPLTDQDVRRILRDELDIQSRF